MANFLPYLFDSGLQNSKINTARSALSSTLSPVDGVPVGQHTLVVRIMKGISKSRPRLDHLFPKWDISLVLSTIRQWGQNKKLDLKLLSLKAVFLMAVVSAKRPSTLVLLSANPNVLMTL